KNNNYYINFGDWSGGAMGPWHTIWVLLIIIPDTMLLTLLLSNLWQAAINNKDILKLVLNIFEDALTQQIYMLHVPGVRVPGEGQPGEDAKCDVDHTIIYLLKLQQLQMNFSQKDKLLRVWLIGIV
ncbi:hypothetical protein ACJX0J_009242, partial [Zea mays]